MGSNPQGKVRIGTGTFPPGVKVGLHHRAGDFPAAGNVGKALHTTSIGDDGTAEFGGLEEGAAFFVVSEKPFRAVAVTAKVETGVAKPAGRVPSEVRKELAGQAVAQGDVNAPPVEGMRSTVTRRPHGTAPGQPAQLAESNRQTAESAIRTDEALKGQRPGEVESIDRQALAAAEGVDHGLGGTSGVHTLDDHLAGSGEDNDAEAARKRSEASRKAAATRRRRAAKKKK